MNPDNDHERSSAEEVRKAARPYSIVVGLLLLGGALIAGVTTIPNSGRGVLGLDPGKPLPRFAAPSALSGIDRDANINQDDTDASGNARTPACKVPGPRTKVIRVPCDYIDRPIVLVAWFTRGCGTCQSQLDTVERVRKLFPNVAFIGLDIRDSLKNARREVLAHRWQFPMAVDRDGAVAGLYGVGVGPTTFFAYPGGIAMETKLGELSREELTLRVRRLIRSSERRGLLP